jgi:pilus assembly protein CpaE
LYIFKVYWPARWRLRTNTPANPSARGHAIAVFGAKGGVGKTTIAVNLAIAIRQCTDQRVALFDADLVMGDVRVHLNLPRGYSLLDLIKHADQLELEGVEQVLTPHESGIRVLLNPVNPIEAELIQAHHTAQILPILVQSHAYVIVDCPTSYDEQLMVIAHQLTTRLLSRDTALNSSVETIDDGYAITPGSAP